MFDMTKDWKWDVPFDKERPILFPKDCQLLSPDKEHYGEVYALTSDLTPEERANPYAKYYYKGVVMPEERDLKCVESGAQMDPKDAFLIEDYAKHMDVPGCCPVRTGYCVMPNGVGFATATITSPGVTKEMVAHFIESFNPPGDMYYKLWCPGAHLRHYADCAIEDVGNGFSLIRFYEGMTPEKVGLNVGSGDEYCIGLTGANTFCHPLHQPGAEPLYVTELCYYRLLPDGYETRVTFWVGASFENGKTVVRPQGGRPADLTFCQILARHSLWETATMFRNIADFWKETN